MAIQVLAGRAIGQRRSFRAPFVNAHPICDNLVVMCGRYRLSRRKQLVEEYFDAVSSEEEWNPRYNIAPTQPVPVIRQNSSGTVRHLCSSNAPICEPRENARPRKFQSLP
jgi:hypothetical protein